MNCTCSSTPIGTGLKMCHPSIEQQAKEMSIALKGDSRKMLRLLIKQFPLSSISILEEPVYYEQFIVSKHREVKIHYGSGFVWTIPNEDIVEFNH